MTRFQKIIFTIIIVVVILGSSAVVLGLLQNEVSFKVYNWMGISSAEADEKRQLFEKAKNAYPKWELQAQNNSFGVLYEQKEYEKLDKLLGEKVNNECPLDNKKISEYCENIFYLEGLVKYRLGQNQKEDEQKELFEKAIYAFEKVLVMNNENIWAQENIDFILNKYNQNQQSKQNEQSQDGQNQEGKQDQKNEQNQKGQEQQDENQQGENKDGEQNQSEQDNGQEQGSEQQGENGEQSENNQPQESRLPQEMQDQLDQYQQELDQQQDQTGFNRSKSAAEKNNLENQDPFEQMMNDPFFQQFFGNDPMMQNMMGEKNLSQDITNPNEKDW